MAFLGYAHEVLRVKSPSVETTGSESIQAMVVQAMCNEHRIDAIAFNGVAINVIRDDHGLRLEEKKSTVALGSKRRMGVSKKFVSSKRTVPQIAIIPNIPEQYPIFNRVFNKAMLSPPTIKTIL